MISFRLNKLRAKEIISNFSKYFDIENSKITDILNNVEEFSTIIENNINEDEEENINKFNDNSFQIYSSNLSNPQQDKDYTSTSINYSNELKGG